MKPKKVDAIIQSVSPKVNQKRRHEMFNLLAELFPICRSLTGEGARKTLEILSREIPLQMHFFPTGMRCFDWEIPEEWNITSAFIKDQSGNTIVDFADNNLHVVNYSEPISGWFSLDELKPHIFTLPERPQSIPYVTSYYHRQWGFCMAHRDFLALRDEKYYVKIDSSLSPGNLIIADAVLPGMVEKEILLSCYFCHPSMANDSLSGVVLVAHLYQELARQERYYGYRFLFVPETIGAIVYLSQHKDSIRRHLHAGFVVTCVGDPGPFNYKQSRHGHHAVDRATENVLKFGGFPYRIRPFWPGGSDERQYCSPGFNLPVGSLMRSIYGEHPEYHTSDDNLNFVTEEALGESLEVYLLVLNALQGNGLYRNTNPYCEPQMSKRGLYPKWGTQKARDEEIQRRMWILNYSDGEHALIDIAEKMNVSIFSLIDTARELQETGLLKRIG